MIKCGICGKGLSDGQLTVCKAANGDRWVEAWGDIRRPLDAAAHAECFVEKNGLASYNRVVSATLAELAGALNEAVIRLSDAERTEELD